MSLTVLEENYRGFQIRRHHLGKEVIICTHCIEGGKETYNNLRIVMDLQVANRGYNLIQGGCVEDGNLVVAISYLRKTKHARVRQSRLANLFKAAVDSLWYNAEKRVD